MSVNPKLTTEQEKKEQEKINFRKRLAQCGTKPVSNTKSQMEAIYFRIVEQGEVTPIVMMSTR
jgi:signal transduction histidine kinase